MKPIVLAITGASGSIYAVRLLEQLLAARREVHLIISRAAAEVFRHELGVELELDRFSPEQLQLDQQVSTSSDEEISKHALSSIMTGAATGRLKYYPVQDYQAGIASGSFLTTGMVICPCSMGTLASIANGLSSNLIHRAAHVHLKEHRKLIVVPRETPLSSIHLGNMKTLADAGAVILPAMPGFYHEPKTIDDLVNFVVARICDQLGIETKLSSRWGKE